MSDLIKREDALKELRLDHKDVIYIDKNECARRIKAIPSADRPQGEWIPSDWFDEWYGRTCECSVCGNEFLRFNFCPNCDARMKGAYDEDN